MKKMVVLIFISFVILGISAYVFYSFYLPDIVAKVIVAEELPAYIPKRIQNRVEGLRTPLNKGSEDLLKELQRANVPVETVVQMIDETTEEQAYRLLDELNDTNIKSSDQVFDIAKKYLPADFNAELLRKPFTENVDIKMIHKGIKYANLNRKTKDVDMETAREIIKRVLFEKEQELNNNHIDKRK